MIRYKATLMMIEQRVDALNTTWRERAQLKNEAAVAQESFAGETGIWSEIKPVYMALQEGKCCYCERALESATAGKIEWDVEHFRPKNRLSAWSPSAGLEIEPPFGEASAQGYYKLAHHLLNYLGSCKVCNTIYKKDRFPIEGKRLTAIESPHAGKDELHLLLYPLGSFDTDPEQLLTFQGYICVPRAKRGRAKKRALTTIDFFQLNTRDSLIMQRAELIASLEPLLRLAPAERATSIYKKRIADGTIAHANCLRAFLATFKDDRSLAKKYAEQAMDYVESHSSQSK